MKMKQFAALLLAAIAGITASCSRGDGDKASSAVLPEAEVVDIVNAVVAKDVAKVAALLQTNPKLIKAKFKSGGPVDGWPLLMIAAEQGDKPLVELLLASGADVNDTNYSDEVALHYAALGGFKDIVQLLFDHHAEINVKNEVGATPLTLATSAGKQEVVTLLKQHGAKE